MNWKNCLILSVIIWGYGQALSTAALVGPRPLGPRKVAREQGLDAGLRIIADYAKHRQEDHDTTTLEVVEAIRTAATTDSKFNFHLLERIALLAILGFEAASGSPKGDE